MRRFSPCRPSTALTLFLGMMPSSTVTRRIASYRTVPYYIVWYHTLLVLPIGVLFQEGPDGPFQDFCPHPARQRLVEEP